MTMRYLVKGAAGYLWMLALVAVAAHILRIRMPPDWEARLGGPELYDTHFALFDQHAWSTYLHLVFGALLAALIPFQLSGRLRRAYLPVHRVSGVLFICAGLIAASTGAYLSIVMPFGGRPETGLVVAMVALFVWCLIQALRAALTGAIYTHRQWVVRSIAITLSIATQRVVFSVLLLLQWGSVRTAFWVAIAIAVPLNLAVAEWFILSAADLSERRRRTLRESP
jgi:hypothetical protein